MAKRADELKARTEQANSARKRVVVGVKPVTASMQQKRDQLARTKKRALHARTKSQADAKAGKPGDGKKVPRWRTGPNGGEDQTTNGVGSGATRGADGPANARRPSRKNTRGAWPGGEKRESNLTRRVTRAVSAPSARAARHK